MGDKHVKENGVKGKRVHYSYSPRLLTRIRGRFGLIVYSRGLRWLTSSRKYRGHHEGQATDQEEPRSTSEPYSELQHSEKSRRSASADTVLLCKKDARVHQKGSDLTMRVKSSSDKPSKAGQAKSQQFTALKSRRSPQSVTTTRKAPSSSSQQKMKSAPVKKETKKKATSAAIVESQDMMISSSNPNTSSIRQLRGVTSWQYREDDIESIAQSVISSAIDDSIHESRPVVVEAKDDSAGTISGMVRNLIAKQQQAANKSATT